MSKREHDTKNANGEQIRVAQACSKRMITLVGEGENSHLSGEVRTFHTGGCLVLMAKSNKGKGTSKVRIRHYRHYSEARDVLYQHCNLHRRG